MTTFYTYPEPTPSRAPGNKPSVSCPAPPASVHPIISANVSRFRPISARPAADTCKPLQVRWPGRGSRPARPGHKALNRIVGQLAVLRAVGLDPACAEGVHPERLRKLAREGERFTAQHLRALSLLRRRATLVATVLDTTARLTDDGIGLFDRAVGRMFRVPKHARRMPCCATPVPPTKVRLFAKLGAALIAAREEKADLDNAVALSVGWEKLAASIAEAARLTRPDKVDLLALARCAWPVLHRLGPVFLDTFQLRAVPATAATLRAIGFLRPAWRDAVRDSGSEGSTDHRHTWEAATLLALRDRLRSGDIWVQGSRQRRAIGPCYPARPMA